MLSLADFKRIVVSPAGGVFALSLLFLITVLIQAGWNPLELARIGTRFSELDPAGTEGYDGQFVYYIARDPNPQSVAAHLDVPAYRYQRILLPLIGRVLSFGNMNALAWVLPAVSLAAHTWAVYLLSSIFESWKINRWYALTYGLWVGSILALRLDLPEPLAFSLILTAVWFQLKERHGFAAAFYSLAIFAKETTIFFVLAQGLVYLIERRWRLLAQLVLITGLPFIAFRLWMLQAFGSPGFGLGGAGATGFELLPFNGLLRVGEYSAQFRLVLTVVYLPAILLPAIWGIFSSVKRWISGQREFSSAALFLNAAIYPFLPLSLYIEPLGTLRLATGLQLAILLYAARFNIKRALNYSLFWIFLDALILSQVFG